MVSPLLVGRLRRIGIWHPVQKAHRLIAPPVCGGIHQIVGALGSRRLPIDLVLKHHYDYSPIHIDPKIITGRLSSHAGFPQTRRGPKRLLDSYRTWHNLGGSWKSAQRHVTRNIAGRFVADGEWDRDVTPFEPLPSIVHIFVEGARPEDTVEYQRFVSKIEESNFAWTRGFRSVQEVDAYFFDLIRIFEDMSTRGYRTQLDLGRDGADEIRVCIDRDGCVNILGGGTHRLSMALILEIDRVPVIVKRVHPLWVAECVRRYDGSVESAISRGVEDLTRVSSQDETTHEAAHRESDPTPDGSPPQRKQSSC